MPWVQPLCFGWGGRGQIEATGENEHPSFPDLFCKFFLWPAAKHATGVTILSKNRKRFTKDTALLQRIFLFAKNVLDAACKWPVLDVQFRKLCRSIVGPPPEVDWNAAWNEVLHLWNERVKNFIANAHVNTWSYITCKNYWNLARHVAALPAHRWVNVCYRGILLVLVAWAVHDILGNPNFMRIAGTQIWDHGENWMTSCGTHI